MSDTWRNTKTPTILVALEITICDPMCRERA